MVMMITEYIIAELQAYINAHLKEKNNKAVRLKLPFRYGTVPESDRWKNELSGYITKRKDRNSFAVLLSRMREERGLTPAQLYTAALIDRRVYSKMMSSVMYHPSRGTVLSFAFALRVSRDELDELMASAGYCISNTSVEDLVIQFCIEKQIYNLFEVNELLVHMKQKPLGSF